jgi:2-polyprenyl-3-methyl-5-hydroxy-6-metoxy-1,4-benzoquinol methylase
MKQKENKFKNQQYELYIINRLLHLFPNKDAKILDVGGKYGMLLKEYCSVIDGIAALEEAVYLPQYYNEIFVMDVLDFDNFKNYDVVIFGDILEHIKTEDAQ